MNGTGMIFLMAARAIRIQKLREQQEMFLR